MSPSPISDASSPNAPGENLRIARPLVGVALSSGGAKGLAHVGVIQVLEENGIPVDAIAGTSMGAYVGSLWAAGQTGAQLEKLANRIGSRWDVIRMLVDPAITPRRGFIHGRRIRRMLEETIGEVHFEGLKKKLYVVATELSSGGSRVFESGQVSECVHASLAIPGIVRPVALDGVEYVDGGLADPLAVDLLRRVGMDVVIAVSVVPTVEELTRERLALSQEAKNPVGMFRRGLSFVNQHVNYFAKDNILDILRRVAVLPQMRVADMALKRADVGIKPRVTEAGFHDYCNADAYVQAGRAAAEEKIETIRRIVTEPKVDRRTRREEPGLMPI